MRNSEMLWFEDVSAINEPVLSFPVFGRISMKQFFILGIAGIISYGLFSATHGLESAIPISIGAFLTVVKPKIGSTEWMFLSIILFLFGRRVGQKRPFGIKIPKPRKLARIGKKPSTSNHAEPQNKIMPSDLSKPIRLRMRLADPSGKPISSKRKIAYLDSARIGILTTETNGDLEAVIVPQIPGQKSVTISVEVEGEPVLSEVIDIKTPQENLP